MQSNENFVLNTANFSCFSALSSQLISDEATFQNRKLKRNLEMALPQPFGDTAPPFWTGGPGPAGYHNFPNKSLKQKSNVANPNNHSQYPITTGTSVFGLKFKDGVMIAADTSGNYGSLSRYPNTQRVHKVNETTVIASSGDIADFQYLHTLIKSKQTDEDIRGGGVTMRPEALHCWLTRVLYNRRSK